jgi:xanthine dehydrogenase accessory factor
MPMGERRARRPLAFILGANEIASAVAVHLHRAGWACVLSNDPFPPVIRRQMAFHDVLFGERIVIEGVEGAAAENTVELFHCIEQPSCVVVTPLQLSDLIAVHTADLLIDARMQKYSATPDCRHIARLTVGLGPNFVVGENCDLAIETRPAKVGNILESGATETADRTPRTLGGVGGERFVYSAQEGLWHSPLEIGARIYKGVVIGHLGATPIAAPIDGFIRGLVRDGLRAPAGVKLLEIDPRGRAAKWTGIDERGEAIARAVALGVRIKLAERAAAPHPGPLVLH